MRRKRFSIVVPTRNRPHTLPHTVKTCLSQIGFDDYEIVIGDNSDGDETKSYIEALVANDPRGREKIRYQKRPQICSMSENFDAAISQAEGEYIIVIGDDDGILPMALYELDELAASTRAKIVKWRNGLYTWPSLNFHGQADYLGFSLVRSRKTSSGAEQLKESLRTFQYDNLPLLYINAAIHADAVAAMRVAGGKLFPSRAPDVYSGVVLSHIGGEFLDVTVPFTLAGLSGSSNGVSTAFGGVNATPRKDFERLNAEDGIRFHPHVPNITLFPVVDFADAFYWAKARHFPGDHQFSLSRFDLMRACVERCDTDVDAVRRELLRVCEDDPDLTRHVLELMAEPKEIAPAPRLKPALLGADGANLHLETQEFGIKTIEDAVAFVHKVVWPGGAPLRYDLEPHSDLLAERTRQLKNVSELLEDRTHQLGHVSELLNDRTQQLESMSGLLAERTERLEALSELLIERTDRLQRLTDIVAARPSLPSTERNTPEGHA